MKFVLIGAGQRGMVYGGWSVASGQWSVSGIKRENGGAAVQDDGRICGTAGAVKQNETG